MDAPAAVRSVNLLRNKANAVTADAAKYVKAPAPIDFSAYTKRLKFTGSAVNDLQKAYESRSIPKYSASIPAFEVKKRAAMMAVVKSTVDATKADLANLHAQLAAFESGRITEDTSYGELQQRFPAIAKEIEDEIKDHQWQKDSL